MQKLTDEFYLDTNIRPAMIDLTQTIPSLVQTDGVVSVGTPITPVSIPPAPPSTPTTPTFMSPPRTRIVTYRIPTSESSVSFSIAEAIGIRGIPMAQLNETDEESE